jgi:lipopolysaccharide/colanic/teichoic acid biosynthesis glycosyltransferase
VFDIFTCIILLILLSPLIALILLGFGLEYLLLPASRGGLFYTELRISKGKPFKVYKFRIFKTAASSSYLKGHGFVQTKELEQNKNNLTFTGRVLKQIYMDELPQIINILKGEMTLVGPRPSNEVVTWQDGQAGQFQRYLFTCGLTGPFQVVKDAKVKYNQNQIDMDYILFCKTHSGWKILLKDISILWQTVLIVFRAKGV